MVDKIDKSQVEALNSEEYKYGFHDKDVSVFKTEKGINEQVVREISAIKHEPEWMLENVWKLTITLWMPRIQIGVRSEQDRL